MAMKGREVRERLKKVNVHPEVKLIIEAQAEDMYQIQLTIKEMADAFNQFATVLTAVTQSMDGMAVHIEEQGKRLKAPHLEGH